MAGFQPYSDGLSWWMGFEYLTLSSKNSQVAPLSSVVNMMLLLELICCEWLVCTGSSLSDCGGSVGTEGERWRRCIWPAESRPDTSPSDRGRRCLSTEETRLSATQQIVLLDFVCTSHQLKQDRSTYHQPTVHITKQSS